MFRQYLANSDIVICDLHFGNLDDVEFIVDAFKTKGPYEDPKTLILVSSVLAWGDTPRIVKPPEEKEEEEGEGEDEEGIKEEEPKEEEDDEEQGEEEIPEEEKDEENKEGQEGENQGEEGEGTGEEPVEQKAEEEPEEEIPVEYLPFKESDYLIRVPKEKYERFKRLEDAVLNLNIENVKTYVICSGVFYGKGELAFKEILKVLYLFVYNFYVFTRLHGYKIQQSFHILEMERIWSLLFISTTLLNLS